MARRIVRSISWEMDSTPQGGYILAGTDGKVNMDGGYGYVVNIDETGEVQWKHETNGEAYGDVVAVIGGVVVIGGTDHGEVSGSGTRQLLARKYDLDGNQLWQWTGWFDKYTNPHGMIQVVSSDDGGVVALGFVGITEGFTGRDFCAVKLSSSGKKQWRQTDFGGHMTNITDIDAIDTPGKDQYLIGSETPRGKELGVTKPDADGNVLWTHGYEGAGGADGELDFLKALAPDANSGYVALGEAQAYKDESGDRTGVQQVFSVDRDNGNLVYQYIFDGELPGTGREILETLDNTSNDTLLVGGGYNHDDDDGAFITKLIVSNWEDSGNQNGNGGNGGNGNDDGQGRDNGGNDSGSDNGDKGNGNSGNGGTDDNDDGGNSNAGSDNGSGDNENEGC